MPLLRSTTFFLLAASLLILQGCASAPRPVAQGIDADQTLESLRSQGYASVDRFLDAEAAEAITTIGLPSVRLADDAYAEDITTLQAELVANRAGREVCTRLGRHFVLSDAEDAVQIELAVTALRSTSTGAAGASALIGVFVPGPFRLPAGLGGFAADGVARRDGETLLFLRWSEGAGAISEDAKVSAIGDAYQLAGDFARDFSRALIDPRGREGDVRPRVDTAIQDANEALCEARFGRASVAGRGASFLLPLSPEAIDSGAPLPEAAPEAAPEVTPDAAPEVTPEPTLEPSPLTPEA